MRLIKVIELLECLIRDGEGFVWIAGKDKEAMEEAVQALSLIQDNRMVTFFSGDFDVCYETYNLDTAYNEGGFIFQDTRIAEKDSLKMQNDQLKATVCELMDSMRRLFDDRDRLNYLIKEREQDIEKLEKKLKELSDDSKYCKTCKYYDAQDWQPKESV